MLLNWRIPDPFFLIPPIQGQTSLPIEEQELRPLNQRHRGFSWGWFRLMSWPPRTLERESDSVRSHSPINDEPFQIS